MSCSPSRTSAALAEIRCCWSWAWAPRASGPGGFIASLLARGFHVVSFDLRDAGESTHFTTAGGGAVLDAVGWESAHVFGHSLGGQLAQRIAIRHPARVRSLTSSSALPSDATGVRAGRYVRPGFLARMARLRFPAGRDGDIALGLALYRAIAAPGYPPDEAVAIECIERDLAHGCFSLRDTAAQTRQNSARWTSGPLASLRVPALVLHGADDQVLRPSAARRTAAAISGARLRVLPGMGHFIPRELWPTYAAEIRAMATAAAGRATPGKPEGADRARTRPTRC